MSKNEFDALLLKKLQEEELEYKPASWDTLARSLPPALTPASAAGKGKPWLKITGIAAAVALILGTVFVVQLNRNTTTAPEQPQLAQQPAPTPDQVPLPQQVNPPQQPEDAVARTAKPGTATPQRNGLFPGNGQVQPVYHTPVPENGHYNPAPQQPVPGNSPQQIANNLPTPQPIPEIQPVKEEKVAHNPAERNNVAPNAAGNYKDMAFASPFYEGNGTEQKSSKTSVSLGGGVNYGNLNTGYTAGISVRRKVAGDFFVDGSVAMMYNNNANNVAANNGPSLGDANNTAAKPASFSPNQLASPALQPLQKLYYVQFNPSIGYQVEKHVALSVGGDFQQMLNRQEEIVQPESNSAKVFPAFDVGLTTKSEFAITPNIQAGLMYREGLNSLLKSEGSRYVNRRYVQVQFKYNIPVN